MTSLVRPILLGLACSTAQAAPTSKISLRQASADESSALTSPAGLAKRAIRAKAQGLAMPPGEQVVLKVKFDDSLLARPAADGSLSLRADAAPAGLAATVAQFGLRFEPLFSLPEHELVALEARAAANSGKAQPDLRGMMISTPGAGGDLHEAAEALLALGCVEHVGLESLDAPPPPPGDIFPITPDLRPDQLWRHAEAGAGIDFVWGYLGMGQLVSVADVESAYNPDHEELVDMNITNLSTGTMSTEQTRIDHGTATLGVLGAPDNGYGVSGAAPMSNFFFVSTVTTPTTTRSDAIANAAAQLKAGDVLLLELQEDITDPTTDGTFVPAELDAFVFIQSEMAVDAGIVVVASAGNGAQDLDDPSVPEYVSYNNAPDSGAIIVGAGRSGVVETPAFSRTSFSTFGSRVDVQSWGDDSVTTTGYASVNDATDLDQRYTFSFAGTSSAGAVVAGLCASLQSFHEQRFGSPLTPAQMRNRLRNNGRPQVDPGTGHIGPAVDGRATVESFLGGIEAVKVNSATVPIKYPFNPAVFLTAQKEWDAIEETGGGAAFVNNLGELQLKRTGLGLSSKWSIADLHLSMTSGEEDFVIEFDHKVYSDSFEGAGEDGYRGMAIQDGVYLSADGEQWTRLILPGFDTQSPGDGWVRYVTSLDAAAAKGGFSLATTDSVRVRFQRYGANARFGGENGRAFDNITIDQRKVGELQFAQSSLEQNTAEGESALLTIERIGPKTEQVRVGYDVVFLTATRHFDQAVISGTTTFQPGVSEVVFSIPLQEDDLPENTETLRLVLRDPTNGARLGTNDTALVRILDNDWEGPQTLHEHWAGTADIPIANLGNISGPAPLPISISGAVGTISDVRVKVSDLTHERAGDLDLIIEGPDGSFCKLMSDFGNFNVSAEQSLEHLNFCFSDDGTFVSESDELVGGELRPFDHSSGNDQLLDFSNIPSSGTGTLSVFDGGDPNGVWKLHVMDDFQGVGGTPFVGEILGGWELVITVLPSGGGNLPIFVDLRDGPTEFEFDYVGPAGGTYLLERSSDLESWTQVVPVTTTGIVRSLSFGKSDPDGKQYYRFREN